MISKGQAKEIIAMLAKRKQATGVFDSHEFIDLYRAHYEHDYICMLVKNDSNINNTSFQSTNSQIAKFLSANSEDLNIEKIDTLDSINDHGNKTSNARWRLLLNALKFVFVFLLYGVSILFSHDCRAQVEFDVPSFKNNLMYIADTVYIKQDIALLQDFINQGCKKKNPLYNRLRDLYGCSSYTVYGVAVHPIKKADVESSAKLWLNNMWDIINRTKGGLDFSPDDIKYGKCCECHGYYNCDDISEPFFCIKARYRDDLSGNVRYIGYKFPLVSFMKKEPIVWEKLSYKEKNEIYAMDRKNLIKGYEWITSDDCQYINDEATKVNKTYPVETTYYVFDKHPDFAVKLYTWNKHSNETNNYVWCIYDLEGNLLRIHGFEDNMTDEIRLAENMAYWTDYKRNKYDVESEDSLTKQYVEMILSGELEKIKKEYIGKVLGITFAGAVATELSSSYSEQRYINNKILKESLKTSNDLLESIDEDKMQKAIRYVKQIKSDHDNEFNRGRCIRIDDRSFYFSLVDKTGKANHILKIEYVQNGYFESKKIITVVK